MHLGPVGEECEADNWSHRSSVNYAVYPMVSVQEEDGVFPTVSHEGNFMKTIFSNTSFIFFGMPQLSLWTKAKT